MKNSKVERKKLYKKNMFSRMNFILLAACLSFLVIVVQYTDAQEEEQPGVVDLPTKLWVCQADESTILGLYEIDHEQIRDGAPMWVSEEGYQFWKNNGFWYAGEGEWPPNTYFRCVDACPPGAISPPKTGWKANVRFATGSISVSDTPCEESMEL